jgi:hypothetical protein
MGKPPGEVCELGGADAQRTAPSGGGPLSLVAIYIYIMYSLLSYDMIYI